MTSQQPQNQPSQTPNQPQGQPAPQGDEFVQFLQNDPATQGIGEGLDDGDQGGYYDEQGNWIDEPLPEPGVDPNAAPVQTPQPQGQPAAVDPNAQPPAQPQQQPQPQPFAPQLPPDMFSQHERDLLRAAFESFDPEKMLEAQIFISNRTSERQIQAQSQAIAIRQQVIPQAFYDKHAQAVDWYLSQVPPSDRGTKQAADQAMQFAIAAHAEQVGLARAMSEALELMEPVNPVQAAFGQSPAQPAQTGQVAPVQTFPAYQSQQQPPAQPQRAPQGQQAPIPPEQAMTSPSVGGGRPPAATRGPRSNGLAKLHQALDLPIEDLEAASRDMGF